MVFHSCPVTTFSDASLAQAHRTTSAGVFHSAEHHSESPSTTEVDLRRSPGPPHTPPSTTSHSSNAGHEQYRLKCLSDAVPTTAMSSAGAGLPVSSKEARVSLPSGEHSDGRPRSLLITRARRECVVSAPTSTAGFAECCFSEDMIVLDEVKAKVLPSTPENLDVTPSILDGDATSGEGSIM
ncbi:hypothetical protein AX14_000601 [Amanita brunnescens Koide BX004]|nr:hypothetical protein AX14_000601 [Amanita brunnescens Koide BX004]